jgi:type IV secretion system protein VirD4
MLSFQSIAMTYTNYQKTIHAKTIATKTSSGGGGNEAFAEVAKYLTSPEVGPALVFLLVLIIFTSLLGKGKGKISSGRFVGKAEKLQATNFALKQIGNNKCQPCTLWSGTPNYWFGKKHRSISSWIQTALNSPPTTYFPHAERGMLVIGAPGSGKTFSVIDRAIESSFRQGFSTIIYDKKGDQMQLHIPLALRYGYSVQVFAPGEAYSGVINPLDFMSSPQDSTMAGEIGRVIIQNTARDNGKGDEFFRSAGEQLAKGLVQLAKSSKYPDLAMVYAFIQLPNFVDRIDYAVRRNDEHKMDYWIAASFSQLLSSKGCRENRSWY